MGESWICIFLLVCATHQYDPTSSYKLGCRDRLPNCDHYKAGSCEGIYRPWATVNCNNTCGICKGRPTPPPLCKDKIPNCVDYDHDAICFDSQYKYWVEDHCRLYCRKCTPEQLALIDGPVPTVPPCRDRAPDCARKGNSACNEPTELLWATVTCKKYCGLC